MLSSGFINQSGLSSYIGWDQKKTKKNPLKMGTYVTLISTL